MIDDRPQPLIDLLPNLPRAVCAQVDAEVWFPEKGGDPGPAKRLCGVCPELDACLAYALTHDVLGVWGGTTAIERREWRRDHGRRSVPLSTDRILGTHSQGQRKDAA